MLVLLLALTGCAEENNTDFEELTGTWDALWQIENETLGGQLFLTDNGQGFFDIPKKPGSLLLQERVSVDFTWQKDQHNFSIRRLDNNLELNYKILDENEDEIYMSFADEVYVKLLRQK